MVIQINRVGRIFPLALVLVLYAGCWSEGGPLAEVGMTEQEVIALLGPPNEIELPPFPKEADRANPRTAKIFVYKRNFRERHIVTFDEHGKVLKTGFGFVL
jgi:hypothetical protein